MRHLGTFWNGKQNESLYKHNGEFFVQRGREDKFPVSVDEMELFAKRRMMEVMIPFWKGGANENPVR